MPPVLGTGSPKGATHLLGASEAWSSSPQTDEDVTTVKVLPREEHLMTAARFDPTVFVAPRAPADPGIEPHESEQLVARYAHNSVGVDPLIHCLCDLISRVEVAAVGSLGLGVVLAFPSHSEYPFAPSKGCLRREKPL